MSSDDSRDDDLTGRFSQHWLRMSAVLLEELKRRGLTDTPEAQEFIGARRRVMSRLRKLAERRKKAKPETKWQAFLRMIGKPPGSTTKH